MSKTLPPEIIRPIIFYLKNDKESLYSCLLVSRDWCRETVYLLWRQPFHFLYTCNKINSTSQKSINNCNCSKKKRQSQANNLLMTYLSIKFNDELVKEEIIKTKGGNLMFDYLEFLDVLDLHELYSAIEDWTRWNKPNVNKLLLNFLNLKFNLGTFKYNMFKFFFINSPKLQSLSFDTEFTFRKINNNKPCSSLIRENDKFFKFFYIYGDNIKFINDLLINESTYPKNNQFFTNLTEFISTTIGRKTKLFSFLSQICHNIQKLVIRICYGDALEELVSLIKSQQNLIYFELFDAYGGMIEIFKSLKESQYNSLKNLILNKVLINDNNIILFHLKHLQNLQELRFSKCVYEKDVRSNEKNNYWEDLWLPNLKYLEVDFGDHEESKELSSILLGCSPLVNKKF